MKTISDRIAQAQEAFENGFSSEAARKRALDLVARGYEAVRYATTDAILAARTPETDAKNSADFWAIPSDMHHVRDRHFEIALAYTDAFAITRDLLALRTAIKAAEIAAPAPRSEIEEKVEVVRRTIVEEMERRQAAFVQGLELARHFGRLPVSVNAHRVYGHKGTIFVRHFFYLNGKLTPLNTIIAIAEQLEREQG